MLRNLKSIIGMTILLCLVFVFGTGFSPITVLNTTGFYTDYNRDFENGIIADSTWQIKTSDNGWSDWHCCNNISANVVNDSGTNALKVDFTALDDNHNNFTYAGYIPASMFEQYKFYTVTAKVKGINTSEMHVYIVNLSSLNQQKLTQSDTYSEISTTFCATKNSDEYYVALIRAFNDNYGTPSTMYIDSITITPLSSDEHISYFRKTNFDAYINNDFFAGMTEAEKTDCIEQINGPVLFGNLDSASGYLSELTSYKPKASLLAINQMVIHSAATYSPSSDFRFVITGYNGLKYEFDHLKSHNGKLLMVEN